jgi:hypothetical protein
MVSFLLDHFYDWSVSKANPGYLSEVALKQTSRILSHFSVPKMQGSDMMLPFMDDQISARGRWERKCSE